MSTDPLPGQPPATPSANPVKTPAAPQMPPTDLPPGSPAPGPDIVPQPGEPAAQAVPRHARRADPDGSGLRALGPTGELLRRSSAFALRSRPSRLACPASRSRRAPSRRSCRRDRGRTRNTARPAGSRSLPFSRRNSIARPMSLMIEGWMPSVGSSRTSSVGRVTSARPMASCCCCPPERSPPRRRSMSLRTGNSENTSSGMSRSARLSGAKPVSRFSRTVRSGKISRPCGTKPTPRRARS